MSRAMRVLMVVTGVVASLPYSPSTAPDPLSCPLFCPRQESPVCGSDEVTYRYNDTPHVEIQQKQGNTLDKLGQANFHMCDYS